jgi:quinol monooxygenase YgiN
LIKVFEVYTNEAAYKTHIETAHFKKFRDTTNKMVRSRTLMDADPIILGAKPK